MRRSERPLSSVPWIILSGFVLALVVQIFMHQQPGRDKRLDYRPLTEPYSSQTYQGISMGSVHLLSYLLSMRLQLHDNQAGRHIRYGSIDYDLLIEWLYRIYRVNPASEYPMFLASRVYSQTPDKVQIRKMLGLVDKIFTTSPQLFWRNQAEAAVIAKHRLGDLEFALAMAEKLFSQPSTVIMPAWARDMHFLLLADLNEYETGIAVIQALLGSNAISDPDELRFLKEKLLNFQQKLSVFQQNAVKKPDLQP